MKHHVWFFFSCFFLLFSEDLFLNTRQKVGRKEKEEEGEKNGISINGALSIHLLPANERRQRHLHVLVKEEASAPTHPLPPPLSSLPSPPPSALTHLPFTLAKIAASGWAGRGGESANCEG